VAEKTEQPTEHKLQEARKKGQVAVSRDLAKCVIVFPLGEVIFGLQPLWHDALKRLFATVLRWQQAGFAEAAGQALVSSLALIGLSAAVCGVMVGILAVLGFWGQFGVLISPEAMAIKMEKLDPVNNAKGLFSMKKLMEVLLALGKAALVALLTWLVLKSELAHIVNLSSARPGDVYRAATELLHGTFRLLVGAMFLVSILDFAIQKHAHIKGLMMSMEEIMREYKEQEGDPMMKGERKALARELAESGPVAATAKANAVVVNPTHFAVALFYDAERAPVPVVLGKGADGTAQAMIAQAHRLSIPVIRHVWLARALYAVGKPDHPIPAPTMQVVALVYACALEMQQRGGYVALDESGQAPGHAGTAAGMQPGSSRR
jgi:type III secretion protein U